MTPLITSGVGAFERRRIAALLQLPTAAELGQLAQFGLEFLQDQRDAVDVLLHPLVVALIGLGDQFVDLAVSNLVEDAVALPDRQQRGVEKFVNRGQQGPRARRRGGNVGTRVQRAIANRLREALDFRQFPCFAAVEHVQERHGGLRSSLLSWSLEHRTVLWLVMAAAVKIERRHPRGTTLRRH